MSNSYDQVRYPGRPYQQTDPAHLGVFPKLFGLPFAPFETCRMLEIGCGDGVNQINLALAAPGARFVGVDLAAEPIEQARADALACGLRNVEFIARDLCDVGAELGEFDYIVAHGVLTWVPEAARAALFRVIGERLAPNGVAMVSFNALPGARAWQAMRDMLLYETREAGTPREKVNLAVDFLKGAEERWSANEANGLQMIAAARRILQNAPEVMFHDELSEFYTPYMLSDVAARAAEEGLTYLCDARARTNGEAFFPSERHAAERARAGTDWTRFQQYLDFCEMSAFHNAVFIKGAPERSRVAGRLRGLWAQCDVKEVAPDPAKPRERVYFVGGKARLTTDDPSLAELFQALGGCYPMATPLDAVDDLEAVADHIFRLFVSGVVTLTTAPPTVVREAGTRPVASALSRLQAARGEGDLACLTQAILRVETGPLQTLVPLLDGTRTRETLAVDWTAAARLQPPPTPAQLEGALNVLTRAGVMMA